MNFKTTIALLLLLVVVGAYFLLIHDPQPSPSNTTAQGDGEPVFTVDMLRPDDVNRITIQRGDRVVVLAREAGKWWQVEPVRFELNELSAGREFIEAAAALRFTAQRTPGRGDFPERDVLGLDPPVATVTLHQQGSDPVDHVIHLGHTPGVSGYLALQGEEQVYIVNPVLHELARRSPSEWRIRSVRLPNEAAARGVSIRAPEGVIELVKKDGAWRLVDAHEGRADRRAVAQVLESAGIVAIEEFISDEPDNLAVYGLDQPAYALTVSTPKRSRTAAPDSAGEHVRTLAIGRAVNLAEEQFYATVLEDGQSTAPVFVVDRAVRQQLVRDVNTLRDPRLITTAAVDMRQVSLMHADGARITLDRGPGGWTFGEPAPPFDADHDAVATLVERLLFARAQGFVPRIEPDAQPLLTIELTAIARQEAEMLRIFAADDAEQALLVLRDDENTGYVLARSELAPLFQPAIALRDRSMLDIAARDIHMLTVERPDGRAYTFEREGGAADGAWVLQGHTGHEREALQRLLDALLPLRAERWLADAPQPSVGYTITFQEVDGERHQLVIDPVAGTTRSTLADELFAVSPELLSHLAMELRDRTVIRSDAGSIRGVSLQWGADSVAIMRDGPRYVDADGEPFDGQVAAGLFDAVAGLRAERYLVPVADDPAEGELVTLVITLRSDETIRLVVEPEAGRGYLAGDEEWFLLDEATMGRLLGPITPTAAPAPDARR